MNKLNVKQFKKKLIRGLANPDLFKLPLKDDEYEPMIIKVQVTKENSFMTIFFSGSGRTQYNPSINVDFVSYRSPDIEEDFKAIGTKCLRPSLSGLSLMPMFNFKINNPDNVFIKEDIFDVPEDKKDIESIVYLNSFTEEPCWCYVDWGDGNVEDCNSLIHKGVSNNSDVPNYTYDTLYGMKTHYYEQAGEYYIKIKGRIPGLCFSPDKENVFIKEVVKWGNLHLYSIESLFGYGSNEYRPKIKMPKHIDSYSFKYVLNARRAFMYCDIDETELSYEIIHDFVKTFPNLLTSFSMFDTTNISYIPNKFCYNHKNIVSCNMMFYSCKVSYIGDYAFADCKNLRDVFDLTYNSTFQPLPLLTRVGDSVFENDINLVRTDFAFNYISPYGYSYSDLYTNENLGLKTVGNNVFKNCKRLRYVYEPFYQQIGLVSVGESLFEGCEDLVSVEMCFWKCWSLEKIGDNIFKGCTKLRNCYDFGYETYLVNFPDKMFYDLKYYDYLKGISNYESFNGYWASIEEQGGQLVAHNNTLSEFFKFKGYNHNNFPIRKHSKDLFSKEYLTDCISHGDVIFNARANGIFESMIGITNYKTNNRYDTYVISNFTGEAFPVWEVPNFQLLFEGLNSSSYTYGIRNIKIQYIYKNENVFVVNEYGTTINYYDNYADIADVDPIIFGKSSDGAYHYVRSKIGLLDTYYSPIEYDNDTETYKVIECNDPIEYEYVD